MKFSKKVFFILALVMFLSGCSNQKIQVEPKQMGKYFYEGLVYSEDPTNFTRYFLESDQLVDEFDKLLVDKESETINLSASYEGARAEKIDEALKKAVQLKTKMSIVSVTESGKDMQLFIDVYGLNMIELYQQISNKQSQMDQNNYPDNTEGHKEFNDDLLDIILDSFTNATSMEKPIEVTVILREENGQYRIEDKERFLADLALILKTGYIDEAVYETALYDSF